MINRILFTLFIFSTISLFSQEEPQLQYPFGEPGSTPRGVYGDDNREEIKDTEGFEEFARATAVMIHKDAVKGDSIYGKSLKTYLISQFKTTKFDKNVKFLDQPTVGDCTGFLISPDVLVTAGHCIQTMEDAKEWVWLFDYTNELEYNQFDEYITVDLDNLYEVIEVIDAAYSQEDPDTSSDYSVLRLDRKSSRRPYRYRTAGTVKKGTDIYTIGAPTGLPLKLSTESTVVDSSPTSWFKSNIDSFPGNSGGPVFDKNGFIEGILVRGAVDYSNGNYRGDYIYDEACGCIKTVTFEEEGYTVGCQAHKITFLPEELMFRSVYDNIEYAIVNKMKDRYYDWASYSWIFNSEYTTNRGRIEHIAIDVKNYEILEELLNKYSTEYTDEFVRSLLEKAISIKDRKLFDLLLKYELDPDAGYNAPLKLIQQTIKNNETSYAKELIKYGAQLTVKDVSGNTPLHDASSIGNKEIAKLLLANGAKANVKNNRGEYPEDLAEKAGHKSLIKPLRKARKSEK